MEIKKTTMYFVSVLILIVGVGFFFLRGGNSEPSDNIIPGNGEIQNIVLSEKNLNYYPDMIKIKANQPVSISLDSSVQGCLRSFTIRDLGVAKYVKTQEETIDFTPTKKGTFTFTCSMGMGYGKIVVE